MSQAVTSDTMASWRYGMRTVSENFSLIVMCVFMVASLAFLAQQILAYH